MIEYQNRLRLNNCSIERRKKKYKFKIKKHAVIIQGLVKHTNVK
jgi:hypothetical protein